MSVKTQEMWLVDIAQDIIDKHVIGLTFNQLLLGVVLSDDTREWFKTLDQSMQESILRVTLAYMADKGIITQPTENTIVRI